MGAHQTMETWLTRAMTDPDKEKDGKISRFVIRHLVNMMPADEICTIKVEGKQMAPFELATAIRNKASTVLQEYPGRQTYQVLAFYTGGNEPQDRFVSTCMGKVELGEGTTEQADGKGALAQQTRWYEANSSLLHRGMAQLIQGYQVQNQQLIGRNSQLEDRLVQTSEKLEEVAVKLLDMEHNKEMKRLELERSMRREQELMKYLPAMINSVTRKLGGIQLISENASDTAMFDALAEHLEKHPETLMSIMQGGAVPSTLAGAFMDRLKAWQEKRDKKEAEYKALNPSVTDIEADVAGEPQKH